MRMIFAALSLIAAAPAFAGKHHADEPVESVRVEHRDEWTVYLRDQRATQLARLDAYATDARFPLAPGPERYAHQLLDAAGTPCAMAYLVMQTDPELIRATAQTDNDLLMAEQESGPFYDWVVTSGLTREEVAVVQGVAEFYPQNFSFDLGNSVLLTSITINPDAPRMQQRIGTAVSMFRMDDDPSIDLALDRLGDKIYELPPSNLAAL